ncbi:hypothetical protein ABPG74_005298 [Tetrahymena malaccensis]
MGCTSAKSSYIDKKTIIDTTQIEFMGYYNYIQECFSNGNKEKIEDLMLKDNIDASDIQEVKKSVDKDYEQFRNEYIQKNQNCRESTLKEIEAEATNHEQTSPSEIKVFNIVFKKDFLKDQLDKFNAIFISFQNSIVESKFEDQVLGSIKDQTSKLTLDEINTNQEVQKSLFDSYSKQMKEFMDQFKKESHLSQFIKMMLWKRLSGSKDIKTYQLSQLISHSNVMKNRQDFINYIIQLKSDNFQVIIPTKMNAALSLDFNTKNTQLGNASLSVLIPMIGDDKYTFQEVKKKQPEKFSQLIKEVDIDLNKNQSLPTQGVDSPQVQSPQQIINYLGSVLTSK